MIALFDKNGDKLPVVYRGLTLNNPNDDTNDTYELTSVLIDAEHTSVSEVKAQRDGSEIYRPRKSRRLIRLNGAIKKPTMGALFDAIEDLNAAFDPVNAYFGDSSEEDKGFLALTFSRPTDDTGNYASSKKDLQYYARPLAIPVTHISKHDGKAARFVVMLECADPRAYAQAASTASRSNAGALTIDNSLASYSCWPTLTITLTNTGSDVVTFQRVSTHDTRTIRLDLGSCTTSDVIVVDMELRTVTKNGVNAMDLVVSGDYWWLDPESQTLNVANVSGTLAGTVAVGWRKAFA